MQAWRSRRREALNHVLEISRMCKTQQPDEAVTAIDTTDHLESPVCWDTVLSLLQDCTAKKDHSAGRRLHHLFVKNGLDSIPFWGDHLIRLFTSCESLPEAKQAFCRVSEPTLYTWNAIIAAHVKLGDSDTAFALYDAMQQCHLKPDRVMLLSLLKACSHSDMCRSRLLHHQIVRNGLESDAIVGSALVDMNAKCGALREAHKLFKELRNRDVVSWGVLMTGYIQHGFCLPALELFQKMQLEGIKPDRVTFLCILKACSHIGAIGSGRLLHEEVVRSGLETDLAVGNTLIDMYAKCGSVEEACIVLNGLHERDAVSWSALITGYVQHGHDALAFRNFEKMQEEGTKPSKVTYLCVLKACINLAALAQGWLIHEQVIKSGLQSDLDVGNTLIDLYAKCGMPDEAHRVFVQLPKRDIVSWGALVAGYAQVGSCKLVLHFLKDMESQGLKPNDVVFTSILAACSRAGLIQEAQRYFKVMLVDYVITPSIQHYSCLIDLFGRTGRLNEAKRFFEIMPLPADAVAWKSLLTSCKTHGSIDLGRHCFEQVVQLDPEDATNYVLMSCLYADAHMWEDVNKLQGMRRFAHAWKKPGKAWIEVQKEVFEFIMGGRDHEESDEIYSKFHRLGKSLKGDGHVPHLDAVTQGQDKEDSLCNTHLQAHPG